MDTDTFGHRAAAILAADAISKSYRRRPTSLFGRSAGVQALDKVTLELPESSTLLLVGRSGSGKSTLGRCLSGHELPDSGSITLQGRDVREMKGEALRARRRAVQLVFQDAAMSFSPRMNLEGIVSEAMLVAGMSPKLRRERCIQLLEHVQISGAWLSRSARELSGGERNRLAIARALAADPHVIILDEVSSGLDLVTRDHLLGLLRQLQQARRLSYVLITHDLRIAVQFGDTIAVMDAGQVVEYGRSQDILTEPHHGCTKALLHAVSNRGLRRSDSEEQDCC